MSDIVDSFDLAELARAADVTPRTIRYYVQQGLIPAPGTRGPSTRYDRGHLDRLLLIRRWQRLHLPLAEVRRRLEAMGDPDVRDALSELDAEVGIDGPAAKEAGETDALSYVRALLQGGVKPTARGGEGKTGASSLVPTAPSPGAPPRAARPIDQRVRGDDLFDAMEIPTFARVSNDDGTDGLSEEEATLHLSDEGAPLASPAALAGEARPAPPPSRSTWERITLTPDIELHLRRPLTRDDNRRVERLIEFARRLLGEEV